MTDDRRATTPTDLGDGRFFKEITPEMRELMENVDVPCDPDVLHKLMLTLEADVHEGGWDQDHILYMVVGDPKDPYFIRHPMGVVGHPALHLQALWDHGMRFTKDVHALAFATETWQHLTFEQMAEAKPELIEGLLKAAAASPEFAGMSEEELKEEMKTAYYKVAGRMLPMPSEMPPDLRREGRQITLTFRNGTTLGVGRIRGEEPDVGPPVPYELISNPNNTRVNYFIHQMLNDHRPETKPGENLWNTEES